MRDTVSKGALAIFFVANTPRVDDGTIVVAQQGIANTPLIMKRFDGLDVVISHATDAHTNGFEFFLDVTQFHELTHAEWSPVDAAIKHE